MKINYRILARKFGVDGGPLKTLEQLMINLREVIEADVPDEKASEVEAAIVEHLENSLRDEFGLECDLEAVLSQPEEDENDLDPAGGRGLASHE